MALAAENPPKYGTSDRPILPGDRLQVKVTRSDPRQDKVYLQEVFNHALELIDA
jgi:hypothetical protein